jgi:hypothetical protein
VKYCDQSAAPVAAFDAPTNICPGSCIDFTNLSQNATSYQWIFQGASISSSTDMNPSAICYNTPGSYDVMLIANGTTGSDTLNLPGYITVYPAPPPQGIQQSGDTLFANPGSFTYQWYHNGTLISGATDYFYVATASGDYNVVCTDTNDCEVEAVIFNVIASVPALHGGGSLIVQPNPFTGKITFLSGGKIRINDAFGKKIFEKEHVMAGDEADLSFLPTDVYFLTMGTEQKVITIKLVKL